MTTKKRKNKTEEVTDRLSKCRKHIIVNPLITDTSCYAQLEGRVGVVHR